jgi:glycosyltransferase involved in cell wall biosynthesis
MRVLTFLHSFEPGGVERIALRLVRHWREQGIDAPLFLGRRDGAMADDVGRGLDCIVPRARIATAAWETGWMILTLPRVVRAVKPDILFCAGNTYGIVAVALKLILGRSCPPIVAKMSNDLDRRDISWAARTAYRLWLRIQGHFIDHLVGMAPPMFDEIVEGMGVPGNKVSIVSDPALSEATIARMRATPRGRSGAGRRFVAIGRLVAQKNISLMLRAFRGGSAPEDRLLLVGDGPEHASLALLARQLGIADRVEFCGYLADPMALLPRYDVLLLSSNYEGVPAVVLEALAANMAVIATDCSRSMSHLLEGGALGSLVPVRDERAFADAIAVVRPASQNAARSLAQAQRFTIEHAANAYIAVMKATVRNAARKKSSAVEAEAADPWCRHNGRSS